MLLDKQAVTLRIDPPFTWTSGIRAPIYCDNRLLISFPEERRNIVQGFKELIAEKKLEFDVVAGTATAAIPWAAFLAYELNKPMVYVRPEPKGHGAGKQVEGTMPAGARVLIVEDLISTGGSSIKSALACQKEYTAKIVGVLAIFTYEMAKAKESFEKENIACFTLSNFFTLIDVAVASNYLSEDSKEEVLSWSSDPENWWKSIQASRLTQF